MYSGSTNAKRQRADSASAPQVEIGTHVERLRTAVQEFVHGFGLLAGDQTPCGEHLTTSHAHALMFLLRRAGERRPVMQQDLGRGLGIDKSNVARLCAKMERLGHVSQERSPSDGRARLVTLTARGRRLAQQVDAASRDRFAAVLAAVPDARREALLRSLDVLNGAVASINPLGSKKEKLP